MGGKKKAGGKKAKKGDDDGEINPEEMYDILKAQVETLKSRIVLEQERRDNAISRKEEMRIAEEGLGAQQEEHKEDTRSTVKAMTKIYRTMETKQNEAIADKQEAVAAQESEIAKLKQDIEKIKADKEEMLKKKEEDLATLQQRIDTMSSDFAEMLKTTLHKMQERIDDANQTYVDENGNPEGGGFE